jgi:uncharacterized membrane protein
MERSVRLGGTLYAIGIAAMGVQTFIQSDTVIGLEPVPASVPGRLFLAYLTGVILLAAAALIAVGKETRLAAITVGSFMFLWVAVLHIPKLASNLSSGNEWTCLFETLELGAASWVLAGLLGSGPAPKNLSSGSGDFMVEIGRFCFAISFPVFGVLHFINRDYVSSVIPSWIPGHMFWAYFTGVAHIAAGVGILSKVKARLAATMLAIMFALWVLIEHSPRVAANPTFKPGWTSLFIALTTCGGAWIVAGSLASAQAPKTDPVPVSDYV